MSKAQPTIPKADASTGTEGFHVVGIGASAGGLKGLEDFFRKVPNDIGMSFVVIQHLSPQYKSVMPELLARHTNLNVQHADEGAKVKPGTVHLIPPGKNLKVRGGQLRLSDQPLVRGVNLPIDIFFRSLAEEFGERAVAIILSGTGTDGTLGLRDIKGAGGMVMVQSPEAAQFDGMPRSAIATRVVDFVMDADEMPDKLVQYARYPTLSKHQALEESSINRLLFLLERQSGVDFSGYRRSTLLRRLDKRMQMNQVDSLEGYLRYLEGNPGELESLNQDVLIGVTRFFRDTDAFDMLEKQVLPKMWKQFQDRQKGEVQQELRVWSVACSTGEEAYSLAILLDQTAERVGAEPNFKVFATDVDKEKVRVAGLGSYPESITADIPGHLLSKYFHRRADRYIINDSLRRKVIFSLHDVTRNPPFNRIELLSCRNMLIYLTNELQKRVLSNFCFSLRDGGHLFLGSSESLGDFASFFDTLDHKAKIFCYEGGAKPTIMQLRLSRPRAVATAPGSPENSGYSRMERNLFRQVMGRYAPATAIVDDAHTVLMTFGPIQEFLVLPPGKVSFDLLGMAAGTLGALLGTAMHKARQTREPVEYRGLTLGDSSQGPVDLRVDPLPREGRTEQLYAVVIKRRARGEEPNITREISGETEAHLVDLERELQYTKENLQATIEELETANEELQATNEELLASNEELQSTNEELQSVNEELITVNAEYQMKIEQLTQAGNDFDNLLLIAEIHTIFLDKALTIRKFSQGDGPFHLLENDIGRSIRHFAVDLEFPSFFEVIEDVRQTLTPHDGVYASKQGNGWYFVKIVPYRTREDEIRGVVITMIDVSERRNMSQRLHYLEEAQARSGKPIEILLVEDDVDQTRLMTAALNHESFLNTVHVAHDGKTALEFLRERVESGKSQPDLVLLDLMLPDMHGLEVLKAMKADEALAGSTVVIVSAIERQGEINQAYKLGAASYVTKPVTVKRLTEAVAAMGTYWLSMVRLPVADAAGQSA